MTDEATKPEFGPGGYLPPKAAKRARKIVLREQMGTGWPLASIVAAVIVAAAGGVYLYSSTRAPAAPFVAMAPITQIQPGSARVVTSGDGGIAALVVRAGGSVHAFREESDDIRWCPESGRLESAAAAWSPDGALVYGAGASLQPVRSVVHGGIVYVDAATRLPRPPPSTNGTAPVCGEVAD